jgi:hypothetical protein
MSIDWTKLEPHSLLDKLSIPLVSEDDIKHLKESVQTIGLQHPIVLFEDKILDGRCRYKACLQLSQEYKFKFEDKHFVQYTGADPLEFVMSMYVDNRQQNESQRALVAATLVNTKFGYNQYKKGEITQENAAKMAKVSLAQIKIAQEVLKRACPELIKAVREGRRRLGYANSLIGTTKSPVSKEQQKEELEKPRQPRQPTKQQPPKPKASSKANQKQVEFDAFKAQWRNFDEMQKRLFVDAFKDELAGWLEYINQQQALISMTEAPPPLQPNEETVG